MCRCSGSGCGWILYLCKEMYPDICSAAFYGVFQGRGRLIGKFSEKTLAACAYRGELLGSGTIGYSSPFIAVNELTPTRYGSTQIYSECLELELEAPRNVENLPLRIVSRPAVVIRIYSGIL